MKILKIIIKNVRGIQNLDINFKPGLFANKPSLIVAPNGSGKSSMAMAFKWLNRNRMKLDDKNAFNDDITNHPFLQIEADEPAIYVADKDKNTISSKFGIYVINVGLKARGAGVHGGIAMGTSKIVVDPIVLLNKIPSKPDLTDDFVKRIDISQYPPKTFISITNYINNLAMLDELNLKNTLVTDKQFNSLRDIVENTDVTGLGFISARRKILSLLEDQSQKIKNFKYLIDLLAKHYPRTDRAHIVISAFRLLTYIRFNKSKIEQNFEYLDSKRKSKIINDKLKALPKTWKDIKPQKVNDKIIVDIGDAQKISNGERDLSVFLCHLIKAEANLTKGVNILIIDEVFDYLDDANLMVAQYEINKLIEKVKHEGKDIFPIILTHINPCYYKGYAFSDLKVYYLKDMARPRASDNILKLINIRAANKDENEEISKYLFHFHPTYPNKLSDKIPINEWINPLTFKKYCNNQLSIYLGDEKSDEFDPLGVCIALREKIEKYCFDKITSQANKDAFVKVNGTKNKIEFTKRLGIEVPELFSILGNLYNNPLHSTDKSQISIAQTLYSRMNNNHIRDMVKELCKIAR